jgi:magnesium transporter
MLGAAGARSAHPTPGGIPSNAGTHDKRVDPRRARGRRPVHAPAPIPDRRGRHRGRAAIDGDHLSPGIRARRFDADGHDQDVDIATEDLHQIGERRLIWVDIDLDAGGTLDPIADVLNLDQRTRRIIEAEAKRPNLVASVDRWHLTLQALEREGDGVSEPLRRREVDLLAGPGLVVTVHRGPVEALQRFAEELSEETSLGALDAGDLTSAVVDEVLNSYFRLVEALEARIDRLDHAALTGDKDQDILADIVEVRREITSIRRGLAPHRVALAAMSRPDMAAETQVGKPWPGLVDRIDAGLAALEAQRDALLGTFDIHMGRSAQRANDVMKALTVLSAVLLPAVVLAGVMGMNFGLPFFDEPNNFYIVLLAMAIFSIGLVAVAKWRDWI